MQSRIIVLTLLILSIDKIICMRCYEGFNASVAGIPFYHWAERQCKGDSECMIHNVVFKDGNFGVSVRYGGCISSSCSSLAMCEQLFGEESTLTHAQYYTLIAGGYEKIRNFRMDFYQDPETHGQLYYSRGKGREEYHSGVLTFLGNLGFNKKNIKAPLKRYLIEFLANAPAHTNAMIDLLRDLLNSMMVTNEGTRRLSRALSECLSPMYKSNQYEIEILTFILVGFLYPVSLEQNATDVYNNISEGFESISRKDFNYVLPEENIETFLLSLNFFQLFINELAKTNKKTVYHFSIQTIEVYMKAYPDSPIPKAAYSVAEILNRYEEMLSRLYPCSETVNGCEPQNAPKERLLRYRRFKEIIDIVSEGTDPHESINLFAACYDIRFFYLWCDQVTYEDYIEITAAWMHWLKKEKLDPPQLSLANLIFYITRPVNNIAKGMDEDSRKKFRKGIAPRSCKHYFCASDLCNRHGILEALQPSLETFSGKVEHEEL